MLAFYFIFIHCKSAYIDIICSDMVVTCTCWLLQIVAMSAWVEQSRVEGSATSKSN